MAGKYYLGEDDRNALSEMIAAFRKDPTYYTTPNFINQDDTDNFNSECLIAKTPEGGITPLDGVTVGFADCEIYRAVQTTTIGELDLVFCQYSVRVYNLNTEAVAGDTYVPIHKDKAGFWWTSADGLVNVNSVTDGTTTVNLASSINFTNAVTVTEDPAHQANIVLVDAAYSVPGIVNANNQWLGGSDKKFTAIGIGEVTEGGPPDYSPNSLCASYLASASGGDYDGLHIVRSANAASSEWTYSTIWAAGLQLLDNDTGSAPTTIKIGRVPSFAHYGMSIEVNDGTGDLSYFYNGTFYVQKTAGMLGSEFTQHLLCTTGNGSAYGNTLSLMYTRTGFESSGAGFVFGLPLDGNPDGIHDGDTDMLLVYAPTIKFAAPNGVIAGPVTIASTGEITGGSFASIDGGTW